MRTRRAVVGGAAGLGAVLIVASVAWACTSFQTITPSATAGEAGTRITVSGSNAKAHAPVTLRWDSRHAAAAAHATAGADGTFEASVVVPDVAPGVHVLLATDGDGTVARTAFEVLGAPATAAAGGALAAPVTGTTGGASPLAAGLVLAAVTLVLAPVAALAMAARRRAPALARVAERA